MYSKFSDRWNHGKIADVKRDFWSDLRNSVYTDVGLSQEQLDAGQQFIDAGKSLLPPGGNIPNNTSGIIPTADITIPEPPFKFTPIMAIAALAVVFIAYKLRK